jgi:site-specific DNA recombinase
VLNPAKLASLLEIAGMNEPVKLDVPARLKRTGHVMRLITRSGSAASPATDRTLVKAIVQGRTWWRELQTNTAMTIEDLARREGITGPFVARIVRLAFLSPQVLASVIDGTLPAHLTLKRLTAPDAVSVRWGRPSF